MQLTLKNNFKLHLAFLLCCTLILGLVFSRALLSISTIGFALYTLFFYKNISKLKALWLGCICIILPVAFSFLWSNKLLICWRSVQVKLCLPIVALGIIAANFSFKQIKVLVFILSIVLVLSAGYSCIYYFLHRQNVLQNYLLAKVLPVTMDDDHIRFSWLIVLCIIALLWQAIVYSSLKEKIFTGCIVFLLVVFLHFLAAKTGLLCLYFLIALLIVYCIKKNHWLWGVLLSIGIASFALIAYKSFPSLKNRVQYVLYDFGNYSKGIFENGSSDGARVLSIKAGLHITKAYPIHGVGFGDVEDEVNKWHNTNYPNTLAYERFLPTNEFLIYSAGSGIVGCILFIIGLVNLFRTVYSKNIFSYSCILILLIPLFTDDSFEGQFGTTIFAMFIAFCFYFKRFAVSVTA